MCAPNKTVPGLLPCPECRLSQVCSLSNKQTNKQTPGTLSPSPSLKKKAEKNLHKTLRLNCGTRLFSDPGVDLIEVYGAAVEADKRSRLRLRLDLGRLLPKKTVCEDPALPLLDVGQLSLLRLVSV